MYRIVALSCALVFGATAAPAATILVNGLGTLLRAEDVIVGSQSYAVDFLDGTCIDLFGGCNEATDFTFMNSEDALAASEALLAQVFIDASWGLFDSSPSPPRGCDVPTHRCVIFTPFGFVDPLAVTVAVAINTRLESGDAASADFLASPDLDTSFDSAATYARWALIPEPGTGLLMTGGLALLSARKRRGEASVGPHR